MISTIEIENFQSHKQTSINLSPGVNVIKGTSHGGKSAIVRAVKWALLNQPRGDHFVSHFKGKKEGTVVGIEFDNDSYVIRKKDSKVNGYELPGNDLAAIRSDLPDEVQAISHMNTINFESQDEQYYMLNRGTTPGAVAKKLNSLVGLDIIDQTITKLNKLENENTAKKNILETDREQIAESLKDLDFVDDLEQRVVRLESLLAEKIALHAKRNEIKGLVEDIQECQTTIEENTKWLEIKVPVAKIRELVRKRTEIAQNLTQLENVYADITTAMVVKERSDKRIGELISKRESIIKSDAYKKQFCIKCGAHMSNWRKK